MNPVLALKQRVNVKYFTRLCTACLCTAVFLLSAGCSQHETVSAEIPAVTNTEPAPSPSSTPTIAPTPTPDPRLSPVTLVWISDTQGYASSYPESLLTMTQWIVDSKDALNIQYVLQTGDIVNDMTRKREWKAAQDAFDRLVGQVPLFAIAGNHDIKGMMHMYSDFHELMSRQDYVDYPTFGGEEADGRRRYDLVTIGYDDYIIIGAGYNIQRADVDWLNSVLGQYSDRTAILLAHWYLNLKNEPFDADALQLHRVVAANPNVRYVLCGHKHGLLHVEEPYDDDGDGTPDRTVQAIMVDYQGLPEGGEGYLMLLTFDVVDRTVSITSYSPVLDDYDYYDDPSKETFVMPLSTIDPVLN